MKVNVLPVGQLATNCYIVFSKSDAVIIDPGDDAGFIINKIKDLELKPKLILATHGHFDHVLAATELKLAFNIPFFIHKNDEFLLKRMSQTAKYFIGFDPGPAPIPDNFLKESEVIKFGLDKLTVIYTPGHTPGSVSFYSKGVVFSGDLLFSGGAVGRTDLEGGDKQLLDKSIKKILKLPGITTIYAGHGQETSVQEEKQYHLKLTGPQA